MGCHGKPLFFGRPATARVHPGIGDSLSPPLAGVSLGGGFLDGALIAGGSIGRLYPAGGEKTFPFDAKGQGEQEQE
jgi:hypothetical protein